MRPTLGHAILSLALFSSCGGAAPVKVALPVPVQEVAVAPPAPTPAPPPPPSELAAPVPIGPDDATWGARDALVTLVWFGDFQSPFDAKVAGAIDAIEKDYGATRLRVVWKNYPQPSNRRAEPAALAATTVLALSGPQAFWRVHHALHAHPESLADDDLVKAAEDAGVDEGSFRRALASHLADARVDADVGLATRLKVTGAPAIFINGTRVRGAFTVEKLEEILKVEEERASAAVEHGTSREAVYVAMAEYNHDHPPPESAPSTEVSQDSTTVWKAPLGRVPMRGGAAPLVTIVEFADFQCPFSKRVQPTLDQLRAEYGDKLRIAWRNEPLPFHPRAEPAAELALEARAEKGDAGFWAAHDALFAAQPNLDDASLDAIATRLGLDVAKVRHAIAAHVYRTALEADDAVGEDLAATGTPHFFIDGRRLVGAQPVEMFRAVIDDEIAKANAAIGRGTALASVYEALTANGRDVPPPERRTVAGAEHGPWKGAARAKVTIVEFGDFQCPFTKRAEDMLAEVTRDYAGQVKVVWHNLPLPMHPQAALAAQASLEAYGQKGDAGFWRMHDLLFLAAPSGLDRAGLDAAARQLGLDMGLWQAALDAETHKHDIDADVALAHQNRIQGTPFFLVNGYVVNGAVSYRKMKRIIDRALTEAP